MKKYSIIIFLLVCVLTIQQIWSQTVTGIREDFERPFPSSWEVESNNGNQFAKLSYENSQMKIVIDKLGSISGNYFERGGFDGYGSLLYYPNRKVNFSQNSLIKLRIKSDTYISKFTARAFPYASSDNLYINYETYQLFPKISISIPGDNLYHEYLFDFSGLFINEKRIDNGNPLSTDSLYKIKFSFNEENTTYPYASVLDQKDYNADLKAVVYFDDLKIGADVPIVSVTSASILGIGSFRVHDQKKFSFKYEPENANNYYYPEWQVSDQSIVSINEKGIIIGKKAGIVTVTGIFGAVSASLRLVVSPPLTTISGTFDNFDSAQKDSLWTDYFGKYCNIFEVSQSNSEIKFNIDKFGTFTGTNTSFSSSNNIAGFLQLNYEIGKRNYLSLRNNPQISVKIKATSPINRFDVAIGSPKKSYEDVVLPGVGTNSISISGDNIYRNYIFNFNNYRFYDINIDSIINISFQINFGIGPPFPDGILNDYKGTIFFDDFRLGNEVVTTSGCTPPSLKIYPFNQNIALRNPIDTTNHENALKTISGWSFLWLYNGNPESSEKFGIHNSPLKQGNYQLLVTINGCGTYSSSIYQNTVTSCSIFNQNKPIITINGNNLRILNSISGVSYQWIFNGSYEAGQISPVRTTLLREGTYRVLSFKEGCDSLSSDNFIVSNLIITIPSTFCDSFKATKPLIIRQQNNIATNITFPGLAFEWFKNGNLEAGQNSFRHTSPLQEGNYQVKISLFGCSESIYSDIRYIVPAIQVVTLTIVEIKLDSICTSITENLQKEIDVKVYPNPNSGTFYLISKDADIGSVEVINNQGKTVFYQLYDNKVELLNCENGIYFVKVFDRKGFLIKKQKLVIL